MNLEQSEKSRRVKNVGSAGARSILQHLWLRVFSVGEEWLCW
jgi:hypothetical protein